MNEKQITRILCETRPGSSERVLVVIVNDPRDFDIACQQGWYRIPVKRAPRRVGADYLAFYFSGAFPPPQQHHIGFYAPIYAYRLATRAELLPQERDHPRAQDRYFKLEIGPLQPLDYPIPSRKLRRVTFIPTTLARLLQAREINDLWDKRRAQDAWWAALRTNGVDSKAD